MQNQQQVLQELQLLIFEFMGVYPNLQFLGAAIKNCSDQFDLQSPIKNNPFCEKMVREIMYLLIALPLEEIVDQDKMRQIQMLNMKKIDDFSFQLNQHYMMQIQNVQDMSQSKLQQQNFGSNHCCSLVLFNGISSIRGIELSKMNFQQDLDTLNNLKIILKPGLEIRNNCCLLSDENTYILYDPNQISLFCVKQNWEKQNQIIKVDYSHLLDDIDEDF